MVGFQNGISAYILPSAQIELNLTSFEVGLINIFFLIGGILSCFLWGILADMRGRREVLIITSFLNSLLTIILSIIPEAVSLITCRFLNGFFIGAAGSIIFSYFSEFQPLRYRAVCVCYCGLIFTFSWLLLPAISYIILKMELDYSLASLFRITPWRVLLLLIALPEILVGLGFLNMPESPKYFSAKGESRKALLILKRMYASNTGKDPATFPVKKLITENQVIPSNEIPGRRKIVRVMSKLKDDFMSLFRQPLVNGTALASTIMFANMFG